MCSEISLQCRSFLHNGFIANFDSSYGDLAFSPPKCVRECKNVYEYNYCLLLALSHRNKLRIVLICVFQIWL